VEKSPVSIDKRRDVKKIPQKRKKEKRDAEELRERAG